VALRSVNNQTYGYDLNGQNLCHQGRQAILEDTFCHELTLVLKAPLLSNVDNFFWLIHFSVALHTVDPETFVPVAV